MWSQLKYALPATLSGQVVTLALVGGTIYVLQDKQLRQRLIRQGVCFANRVASCAAEIKEEVADIQAEQGYK